MFLLPLCPHGLFLGDPPAAVSLPPFLIQSTGALRVVLQT
jgi:hypothetical protein